MLRFLLSVIIIAAIITIAIIPLFKYLRRLGNANKNWIDQHLLEENRGEVEKNDTNQ